MRATNQLLNTKNYLLAIASLAIAAMLVLSWLATAVHASSIIRVTSNIADVPGGANLVITVAAQNDGDVYELEVDHSMATDFPEFSVYADEADPYGGDGPLFATAGATVTYSAANSEWTLDFGSNITDMIRNNGGDIRFYFALRNIDGDYLWGSMMTTTPENTFDFDVIEGTGDSLLVSVDEDEEDVIIPGVPNTSVGL